MDMALDALVTNYSEWRAIADREHIRAEELARQLAEAQARVQELEAQAPTPISHVHNLGAAGA